jgi:polyisoprenoid-binding protein YceI
VLISCATASGQDTTYTLDARQTTVHFTLGSVLHAVHGTFALKRGSLSLGPSSGKMAGEIMVDARSGESGNGFRDRKMHGEILESERYPEIAFHPSSMEGTLAAEGKSRVQIQGTISLHGGTHEITVPADVNLTAGRWTATMVFHIPYVKWGLKNPSTLFLRADESVEIEIAASGSSDQNLGKH